MVKHTFIIGIRLHSIFSQEQISRCCLDILTFFTMIKISDQQLSLIFTFGNKVSRNMKQCDSGSDVIFAFLLRKKERLIKNCWSRAFVSLSLIIDSWWLITVLLTAAVLLLFQYSELELALNTLVTEFHKAADNGPTMNTTQFQSMISSQMPAIAKVLMTSQLVFQSQII